MRFGITAAIVALALAGTGMARATVGGSGSIEVPGWDAATELGDPFEERCACQPCAIAGLPGTRVQRLNRCGELPCPSSR